ncbi:oleosin-like [Hibiscus syriacus]|nr:oleosin-like [Hibiscus syriacus]
MAAHRPSYRRRKSDTFLQKVKALAPDSGQLLGFIILFILASVLIILTGLAATAVILGFIFFMPLILVSSPVWFPIGAVLFVSIVGFLSSCSFGAVAVAVLLWPYRYANGTQPVESGTLDQRGKRIIDEKYNHAKQYGVKMIA